MTIYRLVLENAVIKKWETGASYPGCSITNKAACKPVQFNSLHDAAVYAYTHTEIPYRVYTVDEAWATVAKMIAQGDAFVPDKNKIIPDPRIFGLDTTSLLIVAGIAVAVFFSGRHR